ncbi:transcriptional regulator GcvA [Paralimibaculum aggregatum]|uniref:Transcriptional regulator GcvA n=1 Tax=Paralimibaculum aggregatum TaxID=3036245 RepID=A0ABQ6LPE1_9RHOB|nr:LysR substrate-binding domain-containing protein [Limibaculum sp. NKW23]GMG82733.1 transcriptional regulator GcvA [Limibaculum sp. NKW23]
MRRLPSLDALVPFEAAARLLNFTAAARELNISQSAVSQQIRNLEASLGVALFERVGRSVRLTQVGKEYQHTVAAALGHIGNATAEIRSARGRPKVTLAADQSIAWLWLMPRLPLFQELIPDVAVRLLVSDVESDCVNDANDLAIVHGDGSWPGHHARRIFAEEVYPVCSPSYLETGPPLDSVDDIYRHVLLHLEDEHWNWMNWRMWLTECGASLPTEDRGLAINNYPLVVEAAKRGQGLALGWNHLVDLEIAAGTLVRPLAESVRTRFGYHAVWPSSRERLPQTEWLCDWLLQAADLPGEAVTRRTV